MSSYSGRHAKLFDLFYSEKPYEQEASFVNSCIQRFQKNTTKRILELACGTGSHAIALEKSGYEIVATDYSRDMLATAKEKAAQISSRIDFRWQDMRNLELQDPPFDAIFCLFDSIGYVETNEALKQVFDGIYRHLRPEGLLLFEFWHAPAMLQSYEPLRVRRWSVPNKEILRLSETTLDCARQLAHVHYHVYELNTDGTYSYFDEIQTNRYFQVQEMSYWLLSNGFVPLKWYNGFHKDENISEQTWHVISVSRKSGNTVQNK